MQPHKIVSREEWIEARKTHMAHEKEYTRARDRLSAERRALPWVKVDKNYVFDGRDGVSTTRLSKRRGIAFYYACSLVFSALPLSFEVGAISPSSQSCSWASARQAASILL